MAAGPPVLWTLTLRGSGTMGNGYTTDIETLAASFITTVNGTAGQAVTFAKVANNQAERTVELTAHETQLAP